MTRRVVRLTVVSLLVQLGCGGPTEPAFAVLAITTTSLAEAPPTVVYSTTVAATGGDGSYTWSLAGGALPDGIGLNASAGIISGRPTVSGSYAFTLRVTSGDGQSATRALALVVEQTCDELPSTAAVRFADANLAGQIRNALALDAQAEITCGRIAGLTNLFANGAGIQSLVGAQNLTSLTGLYLRGNSITDVSPVSGLVGLEILVMGDNSISDIGTLSNLSLTLWDLDVGINPIDDISALSDLVGMKKLYVNEMSITDIGPLAGMVEMGDLDVADNPGLTDIQALLNNPGLTTGDQVFLEGTGVSCADIALLEAKGVMVHSDCS